MKRMLLALLFSALATAALAQTPTQQASTRTDAAVGVAFAQAAVGSVSTATITVPAGLYAYVTAVAIEVCTNGTGTATVNANTTTSNLPSAPSYAFSIAATAQICQRLFEAYASPLKSAVPGTNVVFTGPSPGANNQETIRVHYYLAPG